MADHIQIGDISPRIQYTGDGSQTVFTYPFPIFAAADMEVYLDQVKQSTGFTVNGAGQSAGGDVTFTTAPASGVLVTLRRRLAIQRTSDFQESGEFRSKVINDELDYLTAALQQVDDDVDRSLRLGATDTAALLTLPDKATRIDKALGFDANGDPIASTKTLAQLETEADNAAASAATASTSASNASTSETNAATSATNAATSATNAATSETNAATSATAASTSASNAATSETNADADATATAADAVSTAADAVSTAADTASTAADVTAAAASASAASTSASNAGTSETNAAASASAASTSASNASTSETNASASATAAAASAAMGLYKETQVKSAAYTVVTTDEGDLIKVDASGGAVTITLEALATIGVDFRCAVAKSDSSANNVTVQRSSTDTINGAASIVLTDQYELWDFVGDTSTGLWLGINGTASGITGGDGIDKTGGVLSVDLVASNSGLKITGGKLEADAGTTANKVVKLDGAAKLPAVDGSQLTGLSSGATDAVKTNIILNAFRIAINGGLSVQDMVDGVVDEFEDETGVDTGASTNEFYDPTGDFYHDFETVIPVTADWIDVGTGMTFGTGTINCGSNKAGRSDDTFNGSNDFVIQWKVGETGSGDNHNVGIYETDEDGTYTQNNGSGALTSMTDSFLVRDTNTFTGSTDHGANHTSSTSDLYELKNESGTLKLYQAGALKYTWGTSLTGKTLRLVMGSGNTPYTFVSVQWTKGVLNMTLVSNATTALASPTDAFIVLWQEDVDEITLNTDLKAYASRDGGTTWDQITLTEEATLTTGRILTGSVTLTSSGTSMKYKIETLNTKDQRIHAVGLEWS